MRALTYRGVAAELEGHAAALRHGEVEIEGFVAQQRHVEAQIEGHREKHQAAGEHLNKIQGEVYRIGGEIARVEQQIQHDRELRERLERTHGETERALSELDEHIRGDHQQIETLRQSLADGEPKLAALQQNSAAAGDALQAAEATLGEWQTQWDAYAKNSAEAAQAAEVERTRLAYLDRQAFESAKRLDALREEKRAISVAALGEQVRALEAEHDAQRQKVDAHTKLLDERRAGHEQLAEGERSTGVALNDARTELQRLRGRLASLEALQHAALGQDKSAAGEWLARLGLDKSRRLGEVLEVADGWESAVETVLSGLLEGVLTDTPHAFAKDLAALREADVALVASAIGGAAPAGTLASKVRGPAAVTGMLAQVRLAESLDEAQRLAAKLAPHESAITPAGEWIGPGYARVLRRGGAQAGVLGREREVQVVRQHIDELQKRVDALAGEIDAIRGRKAEAERARDDAQRDLYAVHRRAAELAGQVQSQRGRIETAEARLVKVDAEIAEIEARIAADQDQTREVRSRQEHAVARMGEQEQRRQHLDSERRRLLEAREEARINARMAADEVHQLALGLESKRSAVTSLEQALHRMHAQLGQLQARRTEIAQQLESGHDPATDLESERQTYLNQRLLADRQLVEARKALEERDNEFRGFEQERHRIEHALGQKREAHAEIRLAHQNRQLRAQQLEEAVRDAGHDLAELLAGLPEAVDPAEFQQQLETLDAKIKRLEPVNLAAIQEYEEQSQRKSYLDAQLADLNAALETLEGAIKKIDRETRQRFKETFDRVNAGLQELFPRLFGGGHAYLELTGEDMLDSGVSIMARPPGKRVSNISLLSGGEKALSAVALVFSIFRLNPAPFCLLDEVDAPLDEANIGRFSALVSEMSEHVQFVFVTHNKGTMEAAMQLCGVTMREPGVSRLVQVDLAEAAKLAGAA